MKDNKVVESNSRNSLLISYRVISFVAQTDRDKSQGKIQRISLFNVAFSFS